MCYKNFVFSQFSGPRPWYFLLHKSHDHENHFDCVVATVASPEGNRSSIINVLYDKK
jgi:hypothetical protein